MSEAVFAKYLNGLEREPWGDDENDAGDPVEEEQLIEWEAGRGHIPFWISAAYQAVYETGAREEMSRSATGRYGPSRCWGSGCRSSWCLYGSG